jgi:hypothetical protein
MDSRPQGEQAERPWNDSQEEGRLSRVFDWLVLKRPLWLVANPLASLPHGYSGYDEYSRSLLHDEGLEVPEDDRLGRSLHHVVAFMAELGELGVGLYLHQQAVDCSTPAGKAMLAMCGVFAEFEREMIRERVNAGLARARAQGKRLGRPPVDTSVKRAIRQRRSKGQGMLKIARELGVGVSVVQRVSAAS